MPAHDLISRAAHFFVLAEQASRLACSSYTCFWDLSTPPVVETAPQLPAMAAAVRTVAPLWQEILWSVARYPLPGVLPPEAVPWHNRLVAALEVHRASRDAKLQNPARLALVRLDGCGMPDGQQRPSRLPEWLAEARKIARASSKPARPGMGRFQTHPSREMGALAALAHWRPAPRVITPPETLREWVAFWLERRQSKDPMEKGIAAIALLNLPEADLRSASIPRIPTGELLQQLGQSIRFAAERKDPDYLSLLDWQPVTGTTWPAAEVRSVAQSWLEVTRHRYWRCRYAAWRQLIQWDMAGSLDICGIDLLPELVNAVPTENDASVLRELTRWTPAAQYLTSTGTPDTLSKLQQLESVWESHRASRCSYNRMLAWVAGIRLHQAGLAAGSQESLLKAYISTVADTSDPLVLSVLAQWSPGAEVPRMWHRDWKAAWQQQLLEQEFIAQIAAGALLHQLLEQEHGRSWRCAALELWRAGTKASSEARHILGAAFSRLQEVQARLATGEVVDFEERPVSSAEHHRPPLALPPGRIADNEWKMENEELNMKNGESGMKHQEATPKPNARLGTDSPFSRGGF